jgi:hypothetical protein
MANSRKITIDNRTRQMNGFSKDDYLTCIQKLNPSFVYEGHTRLQLFEMITELRKEKVNVFSPQLRKLRYDKEMMQYKVKAWNQLKGMYTKAYNYKGSFERGTPAYYEIARFMVDDDHCQEAVKDYIRSQKNN